MLAFNSKSSYNNINLNGKLPKWLRLLKVKIEYTNERVKQYFENYNNMQRKCGFEITKSIKKLMNSLVAANDFKIYLTTNLGKPHLLHGDLKEFYAINITGNFRLIVKPVSNNSTDNCTGIIIKGVMDYHGEKYEWIIS